MVQEIIVFLLFFGIIGFFLYRTFTGKGNKAGGSCAKCPSYKQHSGSGSKI